jgi:hypothetical protein
MAGHINVALLYAHLAALKRHAPFLDAVDVFPP